MINTLLSIGSYGTYSVGAVLLIASSVSSLSDHFDVVLAFCGALLSITGILALRWMSKRERFEEDMSRRVSTLEGEQNLLEQELKDWVARWDKHREHDEDFRGYVYRALGAVVPGVALPATVGTNGRECAKKEEKK